MIEFKRGNAAVRSERYRLIRYQDGGEELYDHELDPNEWRNLASSNKHAAIKEQLSRWIPKDWAKSAPTKKAFQFDHTSYTWIHRPSGKITRGSE